MKTNYDLKMQEQLAALDGRKTLLLHACCGPCSSNIIKELSDYFDITIYYSNSNIYPKEEYIRRRDELIHFVERFNKDYDRHVTVIEARYEPDAYVAHLFPLKDTGEKGLRCKLCYHLRMRSAYDYARFHDFDYWTTTLSVSPHKISRWINEIGESYQSDHPTYLYADFKKRNGYLKSTQMTEEYGMYRQNYCGCMFSYQEMMAREYAKNNPKD
ncbi:MAG: epoxyqueuosine reductase QueH [Erysipelotrichaceae bacterium]|nr:epoxyqueuosine reductase QueH [Erysipelotrichaceae bacterium]